MHSFEYSFSPCDLYNIEILPVFCVSGLVGPLTLADIHRCLQFAMEAVHFDQDTKSLPGHPKQQVRITWHLKLNNFEV